jgi:hypothetical protein
MRGAISVTQAPSRGPSGRPTRAPTQVPTARPTQPLPCSSFDGQLFAVSATRLAGSPAFSALSSHLPLAAGQREHDYQRDQRY